MASKFLKNIAKETSSEVDALSKAKNELTCSDYELLRGEVLSKYIKNKDVVHTLLQHNTHDWEISVILELKEEQWFSDTLMYLTSEFRNSIINNKKQVTEVVNGHYPKIHQSLNSWFEICHLVNIDLDEDIRIFTRKCFRHLGDSIDATMMHHIECIYRLLLCTEELKLPKHSKSVTFGNIIEALNNIPLLKNINNKMFCGINVSQWRNIAQHSSYNISGNEIICSYGRNNLKSITINKKELFGFLVDINKIQTLYKIALDFFITEFMSCFEFDDLSLSEESAVSNVSNSFGICGFQCVNIEKNKNIYCITLRSYKAKTKNEFKQSIEYSFSSLISLMSNKKDVVLILQNSSGAESCRVLMKNPKKNGAKA